MSQETKTEFVVSQEGKAFRRVVVMDELDIAPEILKSLSANITIKQKNVARLNERNINMTATSRGNLWWSMELPSLMLRTKFRMAGDVLCPVFDGNMNDPDLSLVWVKPPNMRLVFLCGTYYEPSNNRYSVADSFLFAFSEDKRCWRLPMGNVFETCKLCLGDNPIYSALSLDAFALAYKQLMDGSWNADLTNLHTIEQVNAMFRFKPSNEIFTALPPTAGDWTTLCKKIVVPELELL